MAYEAGDTFTVRDGFPNGYYAAGEQVIVLEVGDDGVPIVGTATHDLEPVGRNIRLVPELEEFLEPSS